MRLVLMLHTRNELKPCYLPAISSIQMVTVYFVFGFYSSINLEISIFCFIQAFHFLPPTFCCWSGVRVSIIQIVGSYSFCKRPKQIDRWDYWMMKKKQRRRRRFDLGVEKGFLPIKGIEKLENPIEKKNTKNTYQKNKESPK